MLKFVTDTLLHGLKEMARKQIAVGFTRTLAKPDWQVPQSIELNNKPETRGPFPPQFRAIKVPWAPAC